VAAYETRLLRSEPVAEGTMAFHFAGPPGMTMAMQSMLGGLGVVEQDIQSEEFYGY
jgi:hypothetical protein